MNLKKVIKGILYRDIKYLVRRGSSVRKFKQRCDTAYHGFHHSRYLASDFHSDFEEFIAYYWIEIMINENPAIIDELISNYTEIQHLQEIAGSIPVELVKKIKSPQRIINFYRDPQGSDAFILDEQGNFHHLHYYEE